MTNLYTLKFISLQTYFAINRWQLFNLSGSGGAPANIDWVRYMMLVPDSRLIAAQAVHQFCAN